MFAGQANCVLESGSATSDHKDDGLATDWGTSFVWMNPPYGLRWNVDEWIEKFISHRNGVALLPDFTSTGWWHLLTASEDVVMFVKPKIYFKNGGPTERGRTNSLGSTLVAMGDSGVQALRNAERNGRGICFQRDAGAIRLPMVAKPLLGRFQKPAESAE